MVKITVAVRHCYKKWYCKQVAVHGINSKACIVKDLDFYYIAGYIVGWYKQGLQKYEKYYEGNWWYSEDKYFDPYAPVVNKELALKIDKYKYSAVELYNYPDVLKYLRLYEQYPQMEYVMKLGLIRLVKSKQILNLVKKDKAFRKWLIQNKENMKYKYYYVSTIIQAYKSKKPLDEIQLIESTKKELSKFSNKNQIKDIIGNEITKLAAYLIKQRTNIYTYYDYIKACKYLNLDMKEERNVYPKDFTRWHDIRIDEYKIKKAEEDEKARKEIYVKFLSVANKYIKLERYKEDIIVIIAKSPNELREEGEKLSHCVGKMNYDMKFIREESLIFFIRKKENKETPFVTMEYSLKSKQILQCYGENNKKPEKEILDYINNKWLPYANRKIKALAA